MRRGSVSERKRERAFSLKFSLGRRACGVSWGHTATGTPRPVGGFLSGPRAGGGERGSHTAEELQPLSSACFQEYVRIQMKNIEKWFPAVPGEGCQRFTEKWLSR